MIARGSEPQGDSTGKAAAQDQLLSNGAVGSGDGLQVQHRMPTQQELVAAGRMDLLNATRLWGGFTAVADLMGVRPNTRYTPSWQAASKTSAEYPALPCIAPVAETATLGSHGGLAVVRLVACVKVGCVSGHGSGYHAQPRSRVRCLLARLCRGEGWAPWARREQ